MPWSKPKPYCTIQKLTVRCSLNSILKSRFLRKLRIKIQEQTIENQVKDWVSQDRKQTAFSIILRHAAVTQHSMVEFPKATACSKQDQFKL